MPDRLANILGQQHVPIKVIRKTTGNVFVMDLIPERIVILLGHRRREI
jgi:hypothetical protein